jgi:hypothetical protein
VSDRRKQAVSIRMNGADIRKVKKLAARLGVHDSDIVRFAVKTMLSRLEPLHDLEARGRSLLPVFIESGTDIVRFFELDAGRLDLIINDGVDPTRRIDRDDIALVALHALQPPYAAIRLSEIRLGGADSARSDNGPSAHPNGAQHSGATNGFAAHGTAAANGSHGGSDLTAEELSTGVRKYLYQKYMFVAKGDSGGRGRE